MFLEAQSIFRMLRSLLRGIHEYSLLNKLWIPSAFCEPEEAVVVSAFAVATSIILKPDFD